MTHTPRPFLLLSATFSCSGCFHPKEPEPPVELPWTMTRWLSGPKSTQGSPPPHLCLSTTYFPFVARICPWSQPYGTFLNFPPGGLRITKCSPELVFCFYLVHPKLWHSLHRP